ncbi:PorT family protein [Hymenobacter gummosus]|uniref:PorT family protein n=1 Tax=Hymenobacter gummosus TaxID=1776032 RepID=A0A431U8B6_9BACT|nr:porin family protein [Hymenobacter gummosus]RTQ53441.1 PorT family protein [Hymenobacter gummosus]
MNRIVLALLAVGLGSAAQAQVRPGLKAGGNLTRYAGDMNAADVKNMLGFSGGFTLNAPLNSDGFFCVQPELLYSQKGMKIVDDAMVQRLHYLDLPVLARINADGFIFEAGPQLGYLLAQKQTVQDDALPGGYAESTDLSGYHRLDVGYVAGVGYQLANGLGLTLRYNGGLRNLPTAESGFTGARNSAFQLFAGYTFGGQR